ncbi:MAG: hypothetical protein ABSE86_21795 [Bryobacteraceae bacterium]
MTRKKTPPIPEPIVQLQRQLDQFRSTQPQRTTLPDSLWQAAVYDECLLLISALLLNGPYGRLPEPGTDHFQAIHNQYVGVPKF